MDALTLHADYMHRMAPVVDSYKDQLNKVEQVLKDDPSLALNDFDKAFLAQMYSNIEHEARRYQRMKNINDRTYSEQVGPYVKHSFNIITALYTTFDLKNVISWQPMSQKRGVIYKMIYQFADTKGGITAGDSIFEPGKTPTKSRYYASDIIKDEEIVFTFDATDSASGIAYYPMKDAATFSLVVTGGAAAGTYTYLGTTSGVWTLQKGGGGSNVGTVNPVTGIVTLDGVDASGATSAIVAYSWNSEQFTDNKQIPRVSVRVDEHEITAGRRNILIDLMLDVSYDYDAQFGGSLNAEMEGMVVQYLQNEMAHRILGEIHDGANGNGGVTYTFSTTPTDGVSNVDHAQELYKVLASMGTKVRKNFGRGTGNIVVVGDDLLNFLKVLPPSIFARSEKPIGDGPYYAGKLNNDYDIYYNPDMPEDDFDVFYRGPSYWEAPYYVGSYLPLMSSDYMLYPDMHAEQGYIALESYSYEYPTMVVTGKVTAS